jgi:hypothetical protein
LLLATPLDELLFTHYIPTISPNSTHPPLPQILLRHRETLALIVAALAAAIGLGGKRAVAHVKRDMRLEVLRILRPAEAAVRRLIVIAASTMTFKPKAITAMPRAKSEALRNRAKNATQTQTRRPSFQLADPRVSIKWSPDATSKRHAKHGPRISSISPMDPTVSAIWLTSHQSPAVAAAAAAPVKPKRTDLVTAEQLVKRLRAITEALEDIPRQAKRLLRWKARREQIAMQRPVYTSPLRAGPPPGYRTDHRREPLRHVDLVLSACHMLAWEARRQDSS